MSDKIRAALAQLEVGNDNHWTEDGLPRMETIKFMTGDQAITRELVNQAVPGFSRSTAAAVLAAAKGSDPVVDLKDVAVNPKTVDDHAELTGSGELAEPQAQASAPVAEVKEDFSKIVASASVEQLSGWLVEARGDLDEARKRKEAANSEFEKMQKAVDAMIIEMEKRGLTEHDNFSTAFSDYLHSQQQIREQRAQQINALRKAGLKLEDLFPKKAPIDSAYARRNQRGTQRPGTNPRK